MAWPSAGPTRAASDSTSDEEFGRLGKDHETPRASTRKGKAKQKPRARATPQKSTNVWLLPGARGAGNRDPDLADVFLWSRLRESGDRESNPASLSAGTGASVTVAPATQARVRCAELLPMRRTAERAARKAHGRRQGVARLRAWVDAQAGAAGKVLETGRSRAARPLAPPSSGPRRDDAPPPGSPKVVTKKRSAAGARQPAVAMAAGLRMPPQLPHQDDERGAEILREVTDTKVGARCSNRCCSGGVRDSL